MKQIILSLLIVATSIINLMAQDCISPENWSIVKDTMPNFSKQHDLFFSSENIGYTTGVRGTLRKTIDGGGTWEIIHGLEGMGTRAIMQTLYFVNDLVGFAGGDGEFSALQNIDNDAEFLRTEDGGITWEKNIIDSMERINDLKFFDTQHGLALFFANNRSHHIGETFDGGRTWGTLETKIRRPEGSEFILAGDRVLLYGLDTLNNTYILLEINEDGTIDYSLNAPPTLSTFHFYNENQGYAISGDVSYKTTDGGLTWEESNFPSTTIWSIVHFADENNGIVANTLYEAVVGGGEVWWNPNGLELFVTTDGGESWERYESGDACAIEGRLSHYSKNGEIHFHAGNINGTYKFDFTSSVYEDIEKVIVRPNPVDEYLFLDNLQELDIRAQIFNVSGQKIYDAKAISKIITRQLESGYYILNLVGQNKMKPIHFLNYKAEKHLR